MRSNLYKFISPSSSSRWIRCTGSVELQMRYPTPFTPTPATRYGTEVHTLAKTLLQSSAPNKMAETLSQAFPEQKEQLMEAWGFHEYVTTLATHESLTMLVEVTQDLSSVYPGMQGTPDVILYNSTSLHILDLKTGATPVDSQNNTQLMLYAYAALHNLKLKPSIITLHIYQDNPRTGHNTNTTLLTFDSLLEFISQVKNILSFVSDGIYKLNLGDHCKYCPVQGRCPAYYKKLSSDYYTLQNSSYNLDSITTEEASRMFTILKDLAPLQEKVSALLLDKPQDELGRYNLTIKTRKLPQKYTDAEQALHKLTDSGVSVDEVAPRVLLSPSKLKKTNKIYYTLLESSDLITAPEETKYITTKS